MVRPGLSEALSELQVRELYLLIWSDCLAMRDRAFQLTGDASAALLNLSATCRLKVLDLGIPLPAIFNDQDPYARALDEIVGQFVEAAQEHSVLYYAELTKAREAYGEKEFPYASRVAARG